MSSQENNTACVLLQTKQWLDNNDDLVVRTADKSVAMVVRHKREYTDEALRQLNSLQYYAFLEKCL